MNAIAFATFGVLVHYNPWVCVNPDGCDWDHPTELEVYSPVFGTSGDRVRQAWEPPIYDIELTGFDLEGFEHGAVVVSRCEIAQNAMRQHCGQSDGQADWVFADNASTPSWVPQEVRAIHGHYTKVIFGVCLQDNDDQRPVGEVVAEARGRAFSDGLLRYTTAIVGSPHEYEMAERWPRNEHDEATYAHTDRRLGRAWTDPDQDGPAVIAYYADWMGKTFHLGLHGDSFWTGTADRSLKTDAAADTGCARPTCADADLDGDGDPTNDPAPPFVFDPEDPWQENSPADCVCREASKLNYRKFLEEGAVNWLGWQHAALAGGLRGKRLAGACRSSASNGAGGSPQVDSLTVGDRLTVKGEYAESLIGSGTL